MLKVENLVTSNWEAALRGMRNPLNSWDRADSRVAPDGTPIIGVKDLALCQRLISNGAVHRKFLRQIIVSMDITAPLFWWKEFDTYRFKECDSCSTMHTITKKLLTLEDFSMETVADSECLKTTVTSLIGNINNLIEVYNSFSNVSDSDEAKAIVEEKKRVWRYIIELLPSAYNQRRTITTNYETILSIIDSRTGHKLKEWRQLIGSLLEQLPYIDEFLWAMNGYRFFFTEKE